MRNTLFVMLILLIIFVYGCVEELEELTGCQKDAKICPDGSSVSRDADNNCEFPECSKQGPGKLNDLDEFINGGGIVSEDDKIPDSELEFKYETKILYKDRFAELDLRKDCYLRGGEYNDCGTLCDIYEECILQCTRTCEKIPLGLN